MRRPATIGCMKRKRTDTPQEQGAILGTPERAKDLESISSQSSFYERQMNHLRKIQEKVDNIKREEEERETKTIKPVFTNELKFKLSDEQKAELQKKREEAAEKRRTQEDRNLTFTPKINKKTAKRAASTPLVTRLYEWESERIERQKRREDEALERELVKKKPKSEESPQTRKGASPQTFLRLYSDAAKYERAKERKRVEQQVKEEEEAKTFFQPKILEKSKRLAERREWEVESGGSRREALGESEENREWKSEEEEEAEADSPQEIRRLILGRWSDETVGMGKMVSVATRLRKNQKLEQEKRKERGSDGGEKERESEDVERRDGEERRGEGEDKDVVEGEASEEEKEVIVEEEEKVEETERKENKMAGERMEEVLEEETKEERKEEEHIEGTKDEVSTEKGEINRKLEEGGNEEEEKDAEKDKKTDDSKRKTEGEEERMEDNHERRIEEERKDDMPEEKHEEQMRKEGSIEIGEKSTKEERKEEVVAEDCEGMRKGEMEEGKDVEKTREEPQEDGSSSKEEKEETEEGTEKIPTDPKTKENTHPPIPPLTLPSPTRIPRLSPHSASSQGQKSSSSRFSTQSAASRLTDGTQNYADRLKRLEFQKMAAEQLRQQAELNECTFQPNIGHPKKEGRRHVPPKDEKVGTPSKQMKGKASHGELNKAKLRLKS
ncbi:hypothetical protein BLNAU_2738 [Blattamonas nauphoetae]|uniref:Uncharacterized protein n=1 Tax=Blattamonas nauphoetae TaxID=2049346 RepID=A0ABQ9YEF9_9EUKA|nr:hypothetical protein BLNAU_2738 [Blattamonas nauphoetae]